MAEGGITSPEGIIMLCVAVLLDGLGFLLFIFGTWFGIDDYGTLDIAGLLVIGGWLWMRSGQLQVTRGAKKTLKRFITTEIIEIIPFVGGICPSWCWLVFKEMAGSGNSPETSEELTENGAEDEETQNENTPSPAPAQGNKNQASNEKSNATAA
jgi:hypothetical protein